MKQLRFITAFAYTFALFLGLFHVYASATSDNLVIYQVQTAGAGSGTASQEIVLLRNLSSSDMNVTGWCIEYSSATNGVTFTQIGCLNESSAQTELWVITDGFISFATSEFKTANPGFVPDALFSAGLAATGGHLRVVDSQKHEVDRVGWGGALHPEGTATPAHTTGQSLSRGTAFPLYDTDNNQQDFSSHSLLNPIPNGIFEKEVVVDLCNNIADVQPYLPAGYLDDGTGACFLDMCPNLDDLQIDVPSGYFLNIDNECEPYPLESRTLFITELYPDAPSYDTNQEFIELYNPYKQDISLNGYKLQVGPSFTKEFVFNEGEIPAESYVIFSDLETDIVLPNGSGVILRLVTPAGNVVSMSAIYSNANDKVSWALVEDNWIFTNQITPGAANKPYLEAAENEIVGVTSVLAPCPVGKYRNPATNRCRNIESAISQLKPCDKDEYRNPATNRCKKVDSKSSSLTPCSLGQQRNPETNRCRKVSVLGASTENDLSKFEDVATTSAAGRLNWPAILFALSATCAYMLYEWRNEIRLKFMQFKTK